ncbi:MAG: immune inhibitor A, partial [SAR202 cluster bacterium]|nr:immune inhibitor A [SAR202 cluster bacterium]
SLTTFVSLAGSASPVLTFWQKQQLRQAQDFGYVEVSADGGKTWTKLVTITGTEDWNQESVNLNAYRGAVIGLRFRLLADASEVSDGWYIDDVRIADNAVAAAYPFTDDMESGLVPWLFDSPWGQTNTAYHSTTTSWTDSPSGNYATNADTSLKLTINLSGTQMPVLDFWQRYSLQENSDFGYVEVSINSGTSWTREYFVTGASATWVNELVDLTAYAGNADVRIRFRLISDGSGVSDGWYVDDISINETKGKAVTYPFLETFGSSTDNWITGPWETVGDAHSGSFGLTDSPLGNYGEDIYGRAILANTIDLSGATHPQLSFWHKYAFYADTNPCHEWEQDRARVYVSSFFGKSGTWQEVGAYGGTQSSWTQVQIDLTTFAGFTDVRVMFVLDDDEGRCYTTYYKREGDGWHIDDIRLQEAPTDITLNTPTGVTMHDADLAWSQNADAGFNRYEVYRAKNANPTLSSALVATLTGVASTTLTDIYTVLQPDRYRYRVYVVDNLGRYSLGSNVVEAVYKVPQVAFPFFDSMEGGTGNWEWGAPWGQVTSSSYSGNTSWTDSPLGSYANNANTSLTTFVSLAGSASPVLTFWQKLQLRQAQDYGYVEVSTDGGKTWTKLLTISGTESWNQESVNLNAYRGAVIGLRFRLLADAANVSDGWYIDDVRIANNAVAAAYPFTDDMESGLAPWLFDSPWGQTKTASHSTSTSWTDSPSGNYGTNADTSLKLTINLATAVIPVLEFWHRYSLQENSDYGYIEVSTNGGANWTREYSITGGSATWAKVRLDLTAYGGSSDVRIRFRLVSDGSGVSDGWYIDDVSIAETSHAPLTYPLFNDFEAGGAPPTSDWTPGPWTLVGSGHSGSGALTDSPLGNYEHDMYGRLILANTIDLSKANKPQLSFWHKYAFYPDTNPCHEWEYDRGRVYVSNFYGKSGTWQELAAYGGTQGTWTKVEVDLTAYVGFTNVRVMFVLDDDEGRCYSTYYKREGDGWYIDDVRIDEVDNTAPAAVADLAEVSSTANSASVRWTATGDDNKTGTARSYDIRYLKGTALTTSNWATANLATGEPTPKAAGSIEDFILKGLAANSTYHIGMVVSDEVGNLSALSNVLVISTFATGTVQVKINAPTEVLTSTTTATSTLAVRLDVDQVTNLNATSYEIKFNPAVLDFVNVLPGLINSTAFPVGLFNESPAGTVTVTQDLPGTTTVTGTGQLATIVFTVIGSASSSSAITASDGVLSDGGASPIPSNWTGDSVTLVDTLSGDANGDRVVNALDVTKIKRIIVRLDALTTGSDANGDGKTNALDLTKAKRIIVGLE